MFISILFIIVKVWKQVYIDGWMDKENVAYLVHCVSVYIHTDNGILFSYKKNEILPFAAMWMNLENIMLCEISQTEEDQYYMVSAVCGI